MMSRPVNRSRCHLRLKNWWDRLRFPRQAALDPGKLGRVECRHLHHAEMDSRAFMNQLATQRISEASDRMLGSAICGLKRNAAIDQCRPDLDNGSTIVLAHPA